MVSHRKRNKCKGQNILGQCKLGPMAKREKSINAQNVPFIPTGKKSKRPDESYRRRCGADLASDLG